ncbi:MAG: phosphoglycerate kinase [Candidatus Omnitrophota bacterium]
MFSQFTKKTLFSKLISGFTAISFILTSVPVSSFANADKLRPSLAKTGNISQITEEMKVFGDNERIIVEDNTIFGPLVKALFNKNKQTGIWNLEEFTVAGQKKTGAVRILGDFDTLFSDQAAIQQKDKQIVAYWMMRNVLAKFEGKRGDSLEKIAELIKQKKIRADVTLILSSPKIGKELMKTAGHYHPALDDPNRQDPKAPGIKDSFTEVYVVLEGEAIYYLQKIDKDGNVVDAVQIHAKKGDIVPIPSTYGHITINPSPDKVLKMMNWVSDEFTSIYPAIRDMKGGAYYFLEEDGKIIPVLNPEYAKQGKKVAELRQGNVDKELAAEIGLPSGKPVYNVLATDRAGDLEKLVAFLNKPESSSDPKFDKILGRVSVSTTPVLTPAPATLTLVPTTTIPTPVQAVPVVSKFLTWAEFEQKEIIGREISQKKRNLAKPVKIAFNIDTFAADQNIMLFGGINRIFDNIFRLLDGNPNFVTAAIFLGDYANGVFSSKERLVKFLKSNLVSGNAKYKVELQGDNLIINGKKITLYNSLAKSEELIRLDVDILIEAIKQGYLDDAEKTKAKGIEEKQQAARIAEYLKSSPKLKVVVITPEEDKGAELVNIPLVNRVNTGTQLNPSSRNFVLAEPVTAVTSLMAKVVEGAVKAQNQRAKMDVIAIEAVRTDREGNRTIDKISSKAGLALRKIMNSDPAAEAKFAGRVFDTAVPTGANAVLLKLRIDGFVSGLTKTVINDAFIQASDGAFKGLIDYEGRPTASSFEASNQKLLVFVPEETEVKDVKVGDGPAYKIVVLKGYYSETGYAKQTLDFVTELAMFEGNIATTQQKAGLEVPKGTIPAIPQKIRLQVVPDGAPIPVVLNSARGRMGINLQRRYWDDPNFVIVGINGVREKDAEKEVTSTFMEFDQVFGEAPYFVELTGGKKHFKFTDKEERIVKINEDTSTLLSEKNGERLYRISTPYGNLLVQLPISQTSGKLKIAMKLHGEDVSRMNLVDNQDGTWTAQGKLKNGTSVGLTYIPGAPFTRMVSVGVRKQLIVPITNVRPDKKAISPGKKESSEEFFARYNPYVKELAIKVLKEMPYLNKRVLFDEASGELTEFGKVLPFVTGGAGRGLISAPAKATIPGMPAADLSLLPGVNTEAIIPVWDLLRIASCASCTTNAAATGAKALLKVLFVVSGHFSTIHAVTNTQGSQFGDILKNITRSVDGRGNIVYETTGASTELGKAINELLNTISGVALRVGNDDGSLVNYDFQVIPKDGLGLPTVEEINKQVKLVTETPEIDGGLQGSLGYADLKTSLEVVGQEFGGVFDPSMTVVNPDTGTVSIGIHYDNERGYVNQYVTLNLLLALHQREIESNPEIIAQSVMAKSGATTGRVSVEAAQKAGATGAIIGSGFYRTLEEKANRNRPEKKRVDVNGQVNAALKKALESGLATPIFNLYISKEDQTSSTVLTSINRQITEGLKDISPEDLVRITVSLEAGELADETLANFADYIQAVRNAISGYVSNSFGNDSKLGAMVSTRIRIALKLNDANVSVDEIEKLAMISGVGGIILPSGMVFKQVSVAFQRVNAAILQSPDSFQKRSELNMQIIPRFLLCANPDFVLNEQEIRGIIDSGVNTYYIQIALAPVLPQIAEFASALKGVKLIKQEIPAEKVPVRILLQNAILGHREGFVNLEEMVKHYLIHDVLFNHSEIVDFTGISPEEIAKTLKRAHELKREGKITGNIVVAVGETDADHKAGNSKGIVGDKVKQMFKYLTAEEVADTVIAYEPIWAISTDLNTGVAASPEYIQDMHASIRSLIRANYARETSEKIRIIYGGTGNPENAEKIMGLPDVDGLLPGGASTKLEDFRKIVVIAQKLADQKNIGKSFYKKMYVAGNQKTYSVGNKFEDFVRIEVDRSKAEVAVGADLSNISKLIAVYMRDPLEGIVKLSQLNKNEIYDIVFYGRPDFNMPINDSKANPNDSRTWEITNYSRIDSIISESIAISDAGGILVFEVHFEPKGTNLKGPQSVRFLVPILEKRLGRTVKFISKPGSSEHYAAIASAKPGDIFLMENLRLDPAIAKLEKSTDEKIRNDFVKKLHVGRNVNNPGAGVVKINMGLGVMHRGEQASVTGDAGVPMIIGTSLANEFELGTEAIRNAKHPAMIVFGGGPKIEDKIPMLKNVIKNTLTRGDKLVVLGGAAIPFLMIKNPGMELGLSKSLVNEGILAAAKEIVEITDEEGVEIVAPIDFVVADRLPADESEQVDMREVKNIPATMGYYDIGSQTVEMFRKMLLDEDGQSKFGTVIVNGPAGVIEFEQFTQGTRGIFEAIAKATKGKAVTPIIGGANTSKKAVSVLGGADTGATVELLGMKASDFSLVSTGGGAFLELLQGLGIPGVEVLRGKAMQYGYKLNSNTVEGFNRIRQAVSDYSAANVPGPFITEEVLESSDKKLYETLEEKVIVETSGIRNQETEQSANFKLKAERKSRDEVEIILQFGDIEAKETVLLYGTGSDVSYRVANEVDTQITPLLNMGNFDLRKKADCERAMGSIQTVKDKVVGLFHEDMESFSYILRMLNTVEEKLKLKAKAEGLEVSPTVETGVTTPISSQPVNLVPAIRNIINQLQLKFNIPEAAIQKFFTVDLMSKTALGGPQLDDLVNTLVKSQQQVAQDESGELRISAAPGFRENGDIVVNIVLEAGNSQQKEEVWAGRSLSTQLPDSEVAKAIDSQEYVVSEIEGEIADILEKGKFDIRKKGDYHALLAKIDSVYENKMSIGSTTGAMVDIIEGGLRALRFQLLANRRAIIISPEFFKLAGATSTLLKAIELAGDNFQFILYGQGADNFRDLLGGTENKNIVIADTLAAAISGLDISPNKILALVSSAEAKEDAGKFIVKRLVFTKNSLSTDVLAMGITTVLDNSEANNASEKFYAAIAGLSKGVVAQEALVNIVKERQEVKAKLNLMYTIELPDMQIALATKQVVTAAETSVISEFITSISG